jgi:hypothetical protein
LAPILDCASLELSGLGDSPPTLVVLEVWL